MKFAMCLETTVGPKWAHARQMGVDHAVVLGPASTNYPLSEYGNVLKLKKQFEDAGLNLAAVEGLVQMDEMKAGTSPSRFGSPPARAATQLTEIFGSPNLFRMRSTWPPFLCDSAARDCALTRLKRKLQIFPKRIIT